MPFFLTDENITLPLTPPIPIHTMEQELREKWIWEEECWKGKEEGLKVIPRLEGQGRDPGSDSSPIAGLQMALLACLVGL